MINVIWNFFSNIYNNLTGRPARTEAQIRQADVSKFMQKLSATDSASAKHYQQIRGGLRWDVVNEETGYWSKNINFTSLIVPPKKVENTKAYLKAVAHQHEIWANTLEENPGNDIFRYKIAKVLDAQIYVAKELNLSDKLAEDILVVSQNDGFNLDSIVNNKVVVAERMNAETGYNCMFVGPNTLIIPPPVSASRTLLNDYRLAVEERTDMRVLEARSTIIVPEFEQEFWQEWFKKIKIYNVIDTAEKAISLQNGRLNTDAWHHPVEVWNWYFFTNLVYPNLPQQIYALLQLREVSKDLRLTLLNSDRSPATEAVEEVAPTEDQLRLRVPAAEAEPVEADNFNFLRFGVWGIVGGVAVISFAIVFPGPAAKVFEIAVKAYLESYSDSNYPF